MTRVHVRLHPDADKGEAAAAIRAWRKHPAETDIRQSSRHLAAAIGHFLRAVGWREVLLSVPWPATRPCWPDLCAMFHAESVTTTDTVEDGTMRIRGVSRE